MFFLFTISNTYIFLFQIWLSIQMLISMLFHSKTFQFNKPSDGINEIH